MTLQAASDAATDVIVLTLPLPPAGLRRNHAAAWKAHKRLKDAYSVEVYEAASKQAPDALRPSSRQRGPLAASLVWRQCGKGDVDNALSSAKIIFDILGCAPVTAAGNDRTYLGLYESDGQITEITVRREQVKRRIEECVIVEISRLPV